MKKKLLITLTAIMGGVIVVLIAQEMTPEQEAAAFDLGEQADLQGAIERAAEARQRLEQQRAEEQKREEEQSSSMNPAGTGN